jgi:hypothetical protein
MSSNAHDDDDDEGSFSPLPYFILRFCTSSKASLSPLRFDELSTLLNVPHRNAPPPPAMPSIGSYRLLLAAFFLSSFNNADDPLANPIIYLHKSAIVKPNAYHEPREHNDDVL